MGIKMKIVTLAILLFLAFSASAAFNTDISVHCQSSSGLRYATDYQSSGGDFCVYPKKYTQGFKNEGKYTHNYGWKIYSDKNNKVDALSFTYEISESDVWSKNGTLVESKTKSIDEFARKQFASVLGNDSGYLENLEAKPWKKEPPKGSDVSRFKRKRMNVKLDSATYTLVKLVATKTTKKEVQYTYVLYKPNNYAPKQQMDYLFMQDAHK